MFYSISYGSLVNLVLIVIKSMMGAEYFALIHVKLYLLTQFKLVFIEN